MLTYDLTARGRKTMYEYLYEAMKADILSGRLTAGEKLPSKRAFAGHLQVSVKTVENTYEQLLLEGYIRSEEKRGYFVNRLEVKNTAAPAYASFVTRFREEEYLADLTANNIQYDKFPFATWAKIMRQTLTDYDTSLLKTVPFNGVEKLRVAIAEHLYRYRGMQVSPDHIIVGCRDGKGGSPCPMSRIPGRAPMSIRSPFPMPTITLSTEEKPVGIPETAAGSVLIASSLS